MPEGGEESSACIKKKLLCCRPPTSLLLPSKKKKNPPRQAEDLAELTALAREAAEIMWEFAALGEKTPAALEVADKARALRAQLRGLISDFAGEGDETALAAALEAFEMLETTLGEYDGGSAAAAPAAAAEGTPAAAAAPAAVAPAEANPFAASAAPAAAAPRPTTAPGSRPDPGSDAPLISFD